VDLAIEVEPDEGDAFHGRVRIALELDRPRRSIELHATGLRLSGARVEAGDANQTGRVEMHAERETAVVRVARLLPAGPAVLELRFRGRLRTDLKGFYAARSGRHRYALTQLAATHARRMFPCFDEPAFKARFRVQVTTGKGHVVLANQPLERKEERADGRVTHHFTRTPRLSTYLVAVAVGAFESTPVSRVGTTPIRIWAPPGGARHGAFARQVARESLTRLEAFFGPPHPYAKLDLIAVPDFEFGAMENVGAVFFRETALLLDPRTANLAERKRVAEVVAHELSHMWFGNLVTMAWWNDLWLNESFATWMAFQVLDDWRPEWNVWRDFVRRRSFALEMDGLRDTHPIYVDLHHPDEATENFDLITYEKGASVVRMLERSLGPRAFRAGVRRYIRAHAEGNTVAADLWRALGEASGTDLEPVVRSWIERPGHPLVRAERGADGDLRLTQERFRNDGRSAKDPAWRIPWVGRVDVGRGRPQRIEARLDRRTARVKLPDGTRFVYANADEGGVFRGAHGPADHAALVRGWKKLTGVERMGWVDHQWALVRAGRESLASFLELVAPLSDDPDPMSLATLADPLLGACDALAAAAGVREAYGQWLLRHFRQKAQEAGWVPRRDEDDDSRGRRAVILQLAGASASVQGEARAACLAAIRDPMAVDPSLIDVAVTIAAQHGDARLFDALERAWRRADNPQQSRRCLLSLARFPEPALQDRALALTLDERVGGGDVAFLLRTALENPLGRERAWRFLKRRWRRLEARMGNMLVTRVVDALPALGTRAYRDEVGAFFAAHPIPTGARALRQARERFDLESAFRRRAAPELRRWLDHASRDAGAAAQP
jgi:puromycin-sensitive aminopeptidase